jgi:hypothetical protein
MVLFVNVAPARGCAHVGGELITNPLQGLSISWVAGAA